MVEHEKHQVGILCHGQLAMMTGEAANSLGISAVALGSGEKSPASFVIPVVKGNYNSPDEQRAFSEMVESFVFDTDHVRQGILQKLHNEGFLIVPNPAVNRMIQDRIALKLHVSDAEIPTARWFPVASKPEAHNAFQRLGRDIVLKTTREGFDGRGNRFVSSQEDLEKAMEDFNGQELIAEERLIVEKELGMMVARDTKGNKAFYPLVESVHKNGMLEYTFLPALVDAKVEQEAMEIGNQVLDSIEGPALIGMELMRTRDGKTVFNEMAGRPHNTGHYSIEACQTSQFENLVRIASKQNVGPTDLVRPDQMVLMHNLNGGTLTDITRDDYQAVEANSGTLHWYHKAPREQTPPRKRGHITLFGKDRNTLMQNAKRAIEAIHFFE